MIVRVKAGWGGLDGGSDSHFFSSEKEAEEFAEGERKRSSRIIIQVYNVHVESLRGLANGLEGVQVFDRYHWVDSGRAERRTISVLREEDSAQVAVCAYFRAFGQDMAEEEEANKFLEKVDEFRQGPDPAARQAAAHAALPKLVELAGDKVRVGWRGERISVDGVNFGWDVGLARHNIEFRIKLLQEQPRLRVINYTGWPK